MIWIGIEIVCDKCSWSNFGGIYKRDSVSEIKKKAKESGWKTINGKNYCPECAEEIKKKERNEEEL
jgi:predicted nucleic acid-binding Zn ribbon protein